MTNPHVIVVGGGHAGCEAAMAAAHMGMDVLLITMNLQTIGQMSCNPAMGGVAKGQIVREIDALGGYSGIVADQSMLQFRMLNRSKGPAVWSPRTQNDRARFAEGWRIALESNPRVHFWQDMVVELLVEDGQVCGVRTGMGRTFYARQVVLTNGTFLNGVIHVGERHMGGGRLGERAATGLTAQLVALGFATGRLKTGTPPRVDGRSLDYACMEEQPGDAHPGKFSYLASTAPLSKQRSCFITYTHAQVHQTLAKGFGRSPMFTGRIQGNSPRYCPSIEEKIHRFKDKDRHQIFVEPEGWNTIEVYVNGFSTSLPLEVQEEALRQVPGFADMRMLRPGYAIEYDYFLPTQLRPTLETKRIQGLYFAGQINGTTGYEEAACQGLMAGINAALREQKRPAFVLGRNQAYIGVLIDDLVHKGTEEPYRMFTSRAEFRMLLRQDNADQRLTPLGYALGLASLERMERVQAKEKGIAALETQLHTWKITPEQANVTLGSIPSSLLKEKQSVAQLIKRPELSLDIVCKLDARLQEYIQHMDPEVVEQVCITLAYASYLAKEQGLVERSKHLEDCAIPANFDYHKLKALSIESREKLTHIRPTTLGAAARISGVRPSDIAIIMVSLGR